MINTAIRAYLDAHRAQHLEHLKQFLRFPSISAQSDRHADCQACAEWLAEQFRLLGMEAVVDKTPNKPAVLAFSEQRPDRTTLLVYGHSDVQPPDPLELWQSPPFEPTVRDGDLFARGASDNKGNLITWLHAAEAYRAVEGDLPVNLKFFIEGEEEVGSPSLGPFVAANAERLRSDCIIVGDAGFHAEGVPSIIYGLRGLVYVEVTVTGARMDLHSGEYGGAVANPLNALAALVASLHDANGRVTLPGFYDDVLPLAPSERAAWQKLAHDDQALMADLGVDSLPGEAGFSTLERTWARPTLDCNGMWGGYTGEGPKTVIPSWAKAKISCRLVCNQRPAAIIESIRRAIQDRRRPGTKVDMKVLSEDEPWLMARDAPGGEQAMAALEEAFGRPCARVRAGGSVPVSIRFRQHLGVDPVLMGYSLPGDRVHSPNERFRIEQFHRGALAGAAVMANLARR